MATQPQCGLIAYDRSTRSCLRNSRPTGTGTCCLRSPSTPRKRAWRTYASHVIVMDRSPNLGAAVCRANSDASQRATGISLFATGGVSSCRSIEHFPPNHLLRAARPPFFLSPFASKGTSEALSLTFALGRAGAGLLGRGNNGHGGG